MAKFLGTCRDDWIYGTDMDDIICGYNGNDWLYGGAGNDTIDGGCGDDHLFGGTGNDILKGGKGNDTYYYNRGDGHDIIMECDCGNRRNVVKLGGDIKPTDIKLYTTPNACNFQDLIIGIKKVDEEYQMRGGHIPQPTGDRFAEDLDGTITVSKGIGHCATNYCNPYSIQAIEFADGTVWEWKDILAQPMYMLETDIIGRTAVEGSILMGNARDNLMYGSCGDDQLFGGAGNDKLYGGVGNDTLSGGIGNDYLEGGKGNDLYLFDRGDGRDIICDCAGNDTLLFGYDVAAQDLLFSRQGKDLVIDVVGSQGQDQINIKNWYCSTAYRVETIEAGGMQLTHTQMDKMIQALAAFGAPQGAGGSWTAQQEQGVNAVISQYWKPA